MERSGFNRIAVTLALTVLVRKNLAELHEMSDFNNDHSYTACSITDTGMSWLLSNQDTLALRKPGKAQASVRRLADDEEVPF
jgi:hypothetical protein